MTNLLSVRVVTDSRGDILGFCLVAEGLFAGFGGEGKPGLRLMLTTSCPSSSVVQSMAWSITSSRRGSELHQPGLRSHFRSGSVAEHDCPGGHHFEGPCPGGPPVGFGAGQCPGDAGVFEAAGQVFDVRLGCLGRFDRQQPASWAGELAALDGELAVFVGNQRVKLFLGHRIVGDQSEDVAFVLPAADDPPRTSDAVPVDLNTLILCALWGRLQPGKPAQQAS